MNKRPPFFVIGTIGMIITALLHAGMSFTTGAGAHGVFFGIYPVFLTFLVLGTVQFARGHHPAGS